MRFVLCSQWICGPIFTWTWRFEFSRARANRNAECDTTQSPTVWIRCSFVQACIGEMVELKFLLKLTVTPEVQWMVSVWVSVWVIHKWKLMIKSEDHQWSCKEMKMKIEMDMIWRWIEHLIMHVVSKKRWFLLASFAMLILVYFSAFE